MQNQPNQANNAAQQQPGGNTEAAGAQRNNVQAVNQQLANEQERISQKWQEQSTLQVNLRKLLVLFDELLIYHRKELEPFLIRLLLHTVLKFVDLQNSYVVYRSSVQPMLNIEEINKNCASSLRLIIKDQLPRALILHKSRQKLDFLEAFFLPLIEINKPLQKIEVAELQAERLGNNEPSLYASNFSREQLIAFCEQHALRDVERFAQQQLRSGVPRSEITNSMAAAPGAVRESQKQRREEFPEFLTDRKELEAWQELDEYRRDQGSATVPGGAANAAGGGGGGGGGATAAIGGGGGTNASAIMQATPSAAHNEGDAAQQQPQNQLTVPNNAGNTNLSIVQQPNQPPGDDLDIEEQNLGGPQQVFEMPLFAEAIAKIAKYQESETRVLREEQQKNHPLEMKVKDKLSLVQSFLERKRLDQQHLASVIMLKVEDPSQVVTCVELTKRGDYILCGTEQGIIYGFRANAAFLPVKKQSGAQAGAAGGKKRGRKRKETTVNEYEEAEEFVPEKVFNIQEASRVREEFEPVQAAAHFKGCEGAVLALSLLYDQLYFLSSSTDHVLRLWCVRQQVVLVQYRAHLTTVWDVQFAPLGYLFVSCSADRTAMLWATDKTTMLRVYYGHTADVTRCRFSPNGRILLTASADQSVRAWTVRTGECLRTLYVNDTPSCLSVSPTGNYLLVGTRQGGVLLFDLVTGRLVNTVHLQPEQEGRYRLPIAGVDFSVDEYVVLANNRQCVAYYNLKELFQNTTSDVYEGFQSSTQEYYDALKKKKNYYGAIEPLEAIELSSKLTTKFFRAVFHPKNFVIAVSKIVYEERVSEY